MPRLLHRVVPSEEPDINRFVLEHGRMPFLSDPIPPWHSRGWLLFQVQLADAHPNAPGRWHHSMRMLETERLLDEPIPQIRFTAAPDPAAMKILNRCVDCWPTATLSGRHSRTSSNGSPGHCVSRRKDRNSKTPPRKRSIGRSTSSICCCSLMTIWERCFATGEAKAGTPMPTIQRLILSANA